MPRGSGGRSSGSGSCQYDLTYELELSELDADGTPTTFSEAVENFNGSFGITSAPKDHHHTNAEKFDFLINNPSSKITFPDQKTNLAASFEENTLKYQIAPTTYQYTDNANNLHSGKVDLEFILNDADSSQPGFQVNVKDQNGAITATTIDTSQATNNPKYIIDNHLFSYVDNIFVAGTNGEGNPFSQTLERNGEIFTPINPINNSSIDGNDAIDGGDDNLINTQGNHTAMIEPMPGDSPAQVDASLLTSVSTGGIPLILLAVVLAKRS